MPTDAIPSAPTPRGAPRAGSRPFVTAILVAHNGARWLPQVLAALEAQERPADRIIAVDTGSGDESAALLRGAIGEANVVAADPSIGFGAAVRLGIARADESWRRDAAAAAEPPGDEWVWLLHDDVEAAPDTLAHLLAETQRDETVGIVGPKARGWYDRRLLLEVGVTMARSGRRETLLERREQDQGQHDGTRQVLSVNTAAMLIRRDVWDELGGLDPALPLMRDDIDLGWRATLAGHRVVCVTDAVVHHAEAASRGRRPVDGEAVPSTSRLPRLDRQNAMWVLLTNLPLVDVPFAVLRLTVGTVLRALGLLVGKLPRRALDEVLAWGSVMLRPDRIIAARSRRRRTRRGSARPATRLLAPRGSGWRHLMETVNLIVGPGPAAAPGGAHRATETGPTAEEAEDLPSGSSRFLRMWLTKPGFLVAAMLAVLTLLACRSLLTGGRLMGGALLPAPDGAADLWRTYTQAWHPVGVGSNTDAPPYLAAIAGLATILFGHASAAVDLLVLGAVPLAGVSAYLAVRRVVPSLPLRVWAAVTYALLPPVVGAVAAGRLSTLVVAVLLPVTALVAVRGVGSGAQPGSIRFAWGAGLLLAVITAFAPLGYVLALALVLISAAVVLHGRRAAGLGWRARLRNGALARLGVIALVPPVLLLPWLPALVRDPSLVLLEAGFPGPGLTDRQLPPAALPLLHPGGPGMYPLVVTAGLLLAALAGLLGTQRRRLVLAGWCAALVGLVAALAQSRVSVTAPTLETAVPAWAGPAMLLAGAGMLLAAAAGAVGARSRIARSDFGWRQPTALLVVVLAGLVPILAAGWWVVTGADGPLQRRDPVLLPAFIAAEGRSADQARTLVLRRTAGDRLSYALLRADGPRLGDAETAPPADVRTGLDGVVADLASGRGGDAAGALLPYGVRYVLLTRPLSGGLVRDIDAVPGLVRVSSPEGSLVWRVQFPSGRLRVLPSRGAEPGAARVVDSGPVGTVTRLPAGPAGRLLVVADRRDSGWRATLNGRTLRATTYDGWAQAFRLPADGGRLVLRHDAGLRPAMLWAQGVALLLVIVLVLPSARRDHESADTEPALDFGNADADEPAPTVASGSVPEPVAGPGPRRRT